MDEARQQSRYILTPSFCCLQFMRPIYQGCMEKGIQHVATHAAEVAVGAGGASVVNGKVKRS